METEQMVNDRTVGDSLPIDNESAEERNAPQLRAADAGADRPNNSSDSARTPARRSRSGAPHTLSMAILTRIIQIICNAALPAAHIFQGYRPS